MKGKLIVFEGTDGSGKATQTKLLFERLEREGKAVRRLTFPRYDKDSSMLVRMYLGGEFGSNPGDVNAFAASTFYAVDRYASYKQDWGGYYEEGGLLVTDRYTTSNAVHQTSKLPEGERKAYLDWLFHFEYELMGLPRPDLVIYLDLPTELSAALRRQREENTGTHADIHEADEAYLRACRDNAAAVVAYDGWHRIDCSRDGQVRSIEDIHEEVWALVQALL
jgi:dTMP kinase